MDLKQLRTFRAVAELGSLSKAADRLRAAQPALSRHIKLLEHELRVELFVRNGRGMLLTSAGRMLLDRTTGLIRQIETDVGGRDGFEVHMLFGIRQADLVRMAAEGYRARSLIAYGTHWYPWFMRRIAEKPVQNSLLAFRNLVTRG